MFNPRLNASDMQVVRVVASYLQEHPFTSRRDCELALAGTHSMFLTRQSLNFLDREGYARRSIESDRYVLTSAGEAHVGYARVFHGDDLLVGQEPYGQPFDDDVLPCVGEPW